LQQELLGCLCLCLCRWLCLAWYCIISLVMRIRAIVEKFILSTRISKMSFVDAQLDCKTSTPILSIVINVWMWRGENSPGRWLIWTQFPDNLDIERLHSPLTMNETFCQ
jgi:hypothetical protein